MNAAVVLVSYAATLTWFGPRLLRRFGRGVSPHLTVAAWLSAVAVVITAWLGAIGLLFVETLASVWRHAALTICMKVLGIAAHLGLPRALSATLDWVLLTAGLVATAVISVRVAHRVRDQRSCSRRHAAVARMVGRPGHQPGVVVIPADQPAAYCVAGQPDTVVVTTAALERLDETQLAAVLAHENAHLTGRHHQVHMLLRALAASAPRLPLFSAAAGAVAELLEMCADDAAARGHGRMPLLGGMLALSGQRSVTAAALGAADTAVLTRVARLSAPAPGRTRWRHAVALITVTGLSILTPLAVGLACHL